MMQSFAGHPPSNRKRERTSKILFYLFFLAAPYILLFPSLKKDWALLDDPDMITYSIRGVEKILLRLDFTGLYPPVNQFGKRFHPGIFFYLGVRTKLIGLDPFVNHLAHFTLLYLHLLFLHFTVFYITKKYRYSILAMVLYLLYAQGKWSSAYYNWYSLMTYDPFLLLCFLGSLSLFYGAHLARERNPVRSTILLLLAVLLAGYAFFTKETCFIFTGVAGLILLFSVKKKYNALNLSPKLCLYYFLGALLFALLFMGVFISLKSRLLFSGGKGADYNMNPGNLIGQIPDLWMMLFQNYTLLLLLLPSSYLFRLYIISREKKNWGTREMVQAVFLVMGLLWWIMFLPWNPKLKRLVLIATWCFALFGALEINGLADFLKEKKKSVISQTPHLVLIIFWASLSSCVVFFAVGKLLFPLKVYLRLLKGAVGFFSLFCLYRLFRDMLSTRQINRLFFSCFMFLTCGSFLLFLFFGFLGAYNFNHKYDGIEGVLVRMVRKVSRDAMPNGRLYFHLPEGHMYIGEMNFRLPLFENRPDLRAFAFSVQPGTIYQRGDIIIHHPWLSKPAQFPYFTFDGKMDRLEPVKIEILFVKGASYGELKNWIIANLSFPRNPKPKFLFKDIQKNWWEIFIVLSQKLTIISMDEKSAVTKTQ